MNLQDRVTDAMCALNESWLSRTTPRFFAVGTEVTRALSMEIVRSRIGEDLAGKSSPTHGRRSRGRPTLTYVDVLKKDAGAQSTAELAGCMENRDDWKQRWRARLRTT